MTAPDLSHGRKEGIGHEKALGGKFYATFFEAPESGYLEPLLHEPGGITTLIDEDPFHYSVMDMEAIAELAGLSVQYGGDWRHPGSQKMLCFSLQEGA